MKKVIILSIAALFLAAGCAKPGPALNSYGSALSPTPDTASGPSSTPASAVRPAASAPTSNSAAPGVVAPISNAKARITKIFFGTYVTPQNSPVQPEHFTGYHTGLDFETFPNEQNIDVPINVICSGKLLRKGYASGYGGYAVQACVIYGQPVTVVYGHLRESSIQPAVGQQLSAGNHLAVLGTGYSTETDGERKHLHLGIHKGTVINILGYVPNKSELSGWLDPRKVLGL